MVPGGGFEPPTRGFSDENGRYSRLNIAELDFHYHIVFDK